MNKNKKLKRKFAGLARVLLAIFTAPFLALGTLGTITIAQATSFTSLDSYAQFINFRSFLGKPVKIPVDSDNPEKVPGGDQDYVYVYPPQFYKNNRAQKLVSLPVKSIYLASGKKISKAKQDEVEKNIESAINNAFANQDQVLSDLKNVLTKSSKEPRKQSYLEQFFHIFNIVRAEETSNTNDNTNVTGTGTNSEITDEDIQTLLDSKDPNTKQLLMLLLLNLLMSQKMADASNTDKQTCLDNGGEWVNNNCVTDNNNNNNSEKQTTCEDSGGSWKSFTSSRSLCLTKCGKTDSKCSGSALADFEESEGIIISSGSDVNIKGCGCPEGQCTDGEGKCIDDGSQTKDEDTDNVPDGQDKCPKSNPDGSGQVNQDSNSPYYGCTCTQIQAKGGYQQQATCPPGGCNGPYYTTYMQQPGSCSNGQVTPAQCVADNSGGGNPSMAQQCNQQYQQDQAKKQDQKDQMQKQLQDMLKQLMGGGNKGGQGGQQGGGKGGDKGGGGGGSGGGGNQGDQGDQGDKKKEGEKTPEQQASLDAAQNKVNDAYNSGDGKITSQQASDLSDQLQSGTIKPDQIDSKINESAKQLSDAQDKIDTSYNSGDGKITSQQASDLSNQLQNGNFKPDQTDSKINQSAGELSDAQNKINDTYNNGENPNFNADQATKLSNSLQSGEFQPSQIDSKINEATGNAPTSAQQAADKQTEEAFNKEVNALNEQGQGYSGPSENTPPSPSPSPSPSQGPSQLADNPDQASVTDQQPLGTPSSNMGFTEQDLQQSQDTANFLGGQQSSLDLFNGGIEAGEAGAAVGNSVSIPDVSDTSSFTPLSTSPDSFWSGEGIGAGLGGNTGVGDMSQFPINTGGLENGIGAGLGNPSQNLPPIPSGTNLGEGIGAGLGNPGATGGLGDLGSALGNMKNPDFGMFGDLNQIMKDIENAVNEGGDRPEATPEGQAQPGEGGAESGGGGGGAQ